MDNDSVQKLQASVDRIAQYIEEWEVDRLQSDKEFQAKSNQLWCEHYVKCRGVMLMETERPGLVRKANKETGELLVEYLNGQQEWVHYTKLTVDFNIATYTINHLKATALQILGKQEH